VNAMIKTEQAYLRTKEMAQNFEDNLEAKKRELRDQNWSDKQIELGLAPSETMCYQMKEELDEYEAIKRGEFDQTITFSNIGIKIIQFRIYLGISQAELAKRLNVSPAQISRDERNDYSGITFNKAKRVLDALGIHPKIVLDEIQMTV
jgi:DNA-binding XRE family transcriptional regulator